MSFAIYDADETAEGLAFPALINELELGFKEGCEVPVRHHHQIRQNGEVDSTLLLMPAWSNGTTKDQYLGVKLVTVMPGNTARKMPGLYSTYILYNKVTGEQLAILDGNTITGRRTVATSALASKYLSRSNSSKLLVIGAGRVASLLAEAHAATRPIRFVKVWNINPANAEKLVSHLNALGFAAKLSENLEADVKEADIITSATLSTEPIINGDWLQEGTHVDLIGAFTPKMRESDDLTIKKSKVYIDTEEALDEAGDIVQPLKSGIINKTHIKATLTDLIRGDAKGRVNDRDITLFKAVGTGLADLVAARLVYKSVKKR